MLFLEILEIKYVFRNVCLKVFVLKKKKKQADHDDLSKLTSTAKNMELVKIYLK